MRYCFRLGAVLLTAVSTLSLLGCTEDLLSPEISDDPTVATGTEHALGRQGGAVATPFRARFFTDLEGLATDPATCGLGPNVFLNTQEGTGQATHLGRFRSQFTFCVDVTDLFDEESPGLLVGDESIPYWNGAGTFTAANGDVLWIAVEGTILPSSDPDFDFEFADPFSIVGGTGRFEGATGGGVTNSVVDFQAEPSRTYHRWTGTLIRRPGA